MAVPGFTVLTEFKFEVGRAIVNASGLQGAVDKVSGSAQNLQAQLMKVGVGFAGSLGLGAGGVLGTLGQIVRSYDRLEQSQLKLGQVIYANKGYLSGINDTNDSLFMADKLITKIAKDSAKFGLDEGVFAEAAGVNVGLTAGAGISPSSAVDLTRNILKAAPSLGLGPNQAQFQVADMLSGNMSQSSRTEQRLLAETDAFKEMIKKHGSATKAVKAFNKEFTTKERFDKLNESFGQFTENADLLRHQANTLSGLFRRLRQGLFGFRGAFSDMGGVIVPLIKQALSSLLNFVNTDFKNIMKNTADIARQIIPKFDIMLVRLQEIADVSRNMQAATVGTGLFHLTGILFSLAKLPLLNKLSGGKLGASVAGMGKKLVEQAGGAEKIGFRVGRMFRFIGTAMIRFLKPLALFFAALTVMSRARGMARVKDIKEVPPQMARITRSMSQFTAIANFLLRPLNAIVDFFASLISPLFQASNWLKLLAFILESLATTVISLMGLLSGLVNTILVPMLTLLGGSRVDSPGGLRNFFDPKLISGNFQEGMDTFFKKILTDSNTMPGAERPTAGVTQNLNGNITIKQEFKEKFEPDRIAFAAVEALRKIGQNSPRGRGQSVETVQ